MEIFMEEFPDLKAKAVPKGDEETFRVVRKKFSLLPPFYWYAWNTFVQRGRPHTAAHDMSPFSIISSDCITTLSG